MREVSIGTDSVAKMGKNCFVTMENLITLTVGEVFMNVIHEYPDLMVHLTLYNAVIAEGALQKLENHKLNTMCTYLDITLDHHQAESDSHACADLLLDYMRHRLNISRYVRQYDLIRSCTRRF